MRTSTGTYLVYSKATFQFYPDPYFNYCMIWEQILNLKNVQPSSGSTWWKREKKSIQGTECATQSEKRILTWSCSSSAPLMDPLPMVRGQIYLQAFLLIQTFAVGLPVPFRNI